ncbi:hypothetical protein [Curtobacterium sp. MCPF17_031]|uniref:hypothetical protein n=1 Tax=Curtobacterium sp. MCPF17_031 TaxID=2175653 RepID=UPI000DAA18BC|nr:hypothetical protein [Curtobacterium sp. MCPF17_031]PZE39740.1 hypothetical protein DEJ31_02690 [Curtobacterium sp. MCPF17_031]
MPTADHARAIANAVLVNTSPDTAHPYSALTWGEQVVIRGEADRQGVTPEVLYAAQLAALTQHQTAERSRIASAQAIAAAIREARR